MQPTLGIAGGVAIEDSATLGWCLREEADLSSALRRYERRRWPVAGRITLAAAAFERALIVGGRLASGRVSTPPAEQSWLAAPAQRLGHGSSLGAADQRQLRRSQ